MSLLSSLSTQSSSRTTAVTTSTATTEITTITEETTDPPPLTVPTPSSDVDIGHILSVLDSVSTDDINVRDQYKTRKVLQNKINS